MSLKNKRISIQNSQSTIVRKSWYAAVFFALLLIIAFMDLNIFPMHPSITFISFFLLLSSIVVLLMFKSREKKLQYLITGENLIASWTLNSAEKSQYINYLFQNEKTKNKGVFLIITFFIVIIFGGITIFIDQGKVAMFFMMLALIIFIALFAFGMPYYYKRKNSRNDGNILIGKKYAYINGYFHNWDFLFSGIKKAAIIHEPFYGICIKYYYTDKTLNNTEEIKIPAPKDFDLKKIINSLMS